MRLTRMNESEAAFVKYLDWAGHTWNREPPVNGKRPDFKVDGEAICEVASIAKNHLPGPIGVTDPLKPIRNKVRGKWPQADATRRAGLPFVLVIHRTSGMALLDNEILAAALYGDLGYGGIYENGRVAFHPELSFLDGGVAYPEGNSGLSALAVLEDFNPTRAALDNALNDAKDPAAPFAEQHSEKMRVLEHLVDSGVYDRWARAPRLRVVHNSKCALPLRPGFFRGRFDQEFGNRSFRDDDLRM